MDERERMSVEALTIEALEPRNRRRGAPLFVLAIVLIGGIVAARFVSRAVGLDAKPSVSPPSRQRRSAGRTGPSMPRPCRPRTRPLAVTGRPDSQSASAHAPQRPDEDTGRLLAEEPRQPLHPRAR